MGNDLTPAAAAIARLPFLAGMPPHLRLIASGGELTEPEREIRDRLDAAADAAAHAEMLDRQRQFRQHAWEDSLSRAAVYRTARLAGLREQQDPDGAVSGWLASGSRTLLLSGESRRGKTFAAYAVGHAAYDGGLWVTAWRVSDLLRALRPNDADPDRQASAWQAATAADLLILDDLGGESRSAWTVEQMLDVMDSRVRCDMRTIVTTNLGQPEVSAAYGDPFVYRLLEAATVRRITGEVLTPAPRF
jgi:DNA replication protein DnaC